MRQDFIEMFPPRRTEMKMNHLNQSALKTAGHSFLVRCLGQNGIKRQTKYFLIREFSNIGFCFYSTSIISHVTVINLWFKQQ